MSCFHCGAEVGHAKDCLGETWLKTARSPIAFAQRRRAALYLGCSDEQDPAVIALTVLLLNESAENRDDLESFKATVGLMLRKLGGKLTITHAELHELVEGYVTVTQDEVTHDQTYEWHAKEGGTLQ